MNVISRIKYLIKNLCSLLMELTKPHDFNWQQNICSKVNSQIDNNAILYGNYRITNSKIGYGTAINKNSSISMTSIGKFCSIGPNFLCGWGIHPINGISINPAFYSSKKQNGFTYSKKNKVDERKQIIIGNDVFIGSNVTVLDGVTIGDGAVIGAGAVVSKDIPAYAVAVGSPIRVIKYRFNEQTINSLLSTKWWDQNEDTLRKVEEHFFDVDGFLNYLNNS